MGMAFNAYSYEWCWHITLKGEIKTRRTENRSWAICIKNSTPTHHHHRPNARANNGNKNEIRELLRNPPYKLPARAFLLSNDGLRSAWRWNYGSIWWMRAMQKKQPRDLENEWTRHPQTSDIWNTMAYRKYYMFYIMFFVFKIAF